MYSDELQIVANETTIAVGGMPIDVCKLATEPSEMPMAVNEIPIDVYEIPMELGEMPIADIEMPMVVNEIPIDVCKSTNYREEYY